MKLLIVRHGDPDYNIDSLTPKGHREAQALAERLCRLPISAAYVSPLGRALDTADYTLKRLGITPTVCDWLREFSPVIDKPNAPQSIAWDWLPQDWTTVDAFYDKEQWHRHTAMVQGDVEREYARVTDGLDALLKSHGYERQGRVYRAVRSHEETVVLFCHFGVECVLLSHLLNVSPMVLWHGTCAAPSSVTTLVSEERREGVAAFRMSAFGDTSHLYADGQEPAFAARFCETYANTEQRH